MAESSIFWTTGGAGDGASPYTMSQIFDWLRRTFTKGAANQGVLLGYGGDLAVSGTSSPVSVAAGAAYVYGIPYENTAALTVAIPTPAASTRVDRIVLRANWAAQTVRITRIAGTEGAGAPALTQNPGTSYDIPLAQVSITTGGVITVADEREFAEFATVLEPAGTIKAFAGPSAPTGYLLCDGSAVSRSTYARLFAAIGTTWGAGDGSTTFNVPDLRGRVPLGKDNMGGVSANRVTATEADNIGQGAGEENHTLSVAEIPAHVHGAAGAHSHTPVNGGSFLSNAGSPDITADASGGGAFRANATTNTEPAHMHGSVGGDGAHNNMPPYATVNWIIKT